MNFRRISKSSTTISVSASQPIQVRRRISKHNRINKDKICNWTQETCFCRYISEELGSAFVAFRLKKKKKTKSQLQKVCLLRRKLQASVVVEYVEVEVIKNKIIIKNLKHIATTRQQKTSAAAADAQNSKPPKIVRKSAPRWQKFWKK